MIQLLRVCGCKLPSSQSCGTTTPRGPLKHFLLKRLFQYLETILIEVIVFGGEGHIKVPEREKKFFQVIEIT
jgi:hypothetical protein